MENKVKVWIARDENGKLYLYFSHPLKGKSVWRLLDSEEDGVVGAIELDYTLFPSVEWEDDEPTEAYITLAEPQPKQKQKQAIGWEQRRYEIAKDMLPVIYRQKVADSNREQGIMLKDIADFAVAFADVLISKLKNENK